MHYWLVMGRVCWCGLRVPPSLGLSCTHGLSCAHFVVSFRVSLLVSLGTSLTLARWLGRCVDCLPLASSVNHLQ